MEVSSSHVKLYTFNAGSFRLEPAVEEFLRSRSAISLDFGISAYINSEAMPSILSELLDRQKVDGSSSADIIANVNSEINRLSTEKQKIMEENARLLSQLSSHTIEISNLKEQAAINIKTIEALNVENARLQAALKNAEATTAHTLPKSVAGIPSDDKLKQSHEKLQKEFHELRSQNIEAIASLKVLEDENEELRRELDQLRNQKNSAIVKASEN